MSNPGDPGGLLEQFLTDAMRGQFQVTRLDTQELSGQVKGLDSKLNWILLVLGLIVTLVLSTYAAIAYYTWRLVSLLIDK